MVSSGMLEYLKQLLTTGQSNDVIQADLLNRGWTSADIEEALKQIISPGVVQNIPPSTSVSPPQPGTLSNPSLSPATSVSKPKSAIVLSVILFIMALLNLPGAFVGSTVVLILNRAVSAAGGLDYAVLKAIPFIGPVSLPAMITVPLLLYAALKLKSGSQAAWKSAFIILSVVFVISLVSGVITSAMITPIKSMVNNY